MKPAMLANLLHLLQLDLERAARGEAIHMPAQRAQLTLEGLQAADVAAERLTKGAT